MGHSHELRRRNLMTATILLVISCGFAASVIYVRYGKGPMLPDNNSSWQSMAQPADAAVAAPAPLMAAPQPTIPAQSQPEAAPHGQPQ